MAHKGKEGSGEKVVYVGDSRVKKAADLLHRLTIRLTLVSRRRSFRTFCSRNGWSG